MEEDRSYLTFECVQINNGTYKSGFATTQAAYDRAQAQLYSGLEEVEKRLTKSRFLLGDK
jgi:putative glutathione S-transferase